jgi:hypothetical protein
MVKIANKIPANPFSEKNLLAVTCENLVKTNNIIIKAEIIKNSKSLNPLFSVLEKSLLKTAARNPIIMVIIYSNCVLNNIGARMLLNSPPIIPPTDIQTK